MTPPVALTVAGSDPSGGAGIQADLKTFSALGAYGAAVLTALTAQSTRGVAGVLPVPAAFVAQQLDVLADDVRLDAVKIGMLGDGAVAEAVGRFLSARRPRVVVLDPVMVATSGDPLLDPAAVDGLRALLPLTDLVTPNVPEAATLLGVPPATDERGLHEQAEALVELGARRVLLKGGHLAGDESVDVLAGPEGVHAFRAPRIATTSTHGTGCTLSSALAALRPQRPDWSVTVADAKAYLTDALRRADELRIGAGHGPVHHFARLWP